MKEHYNVNKFLYFFIYHSEYNAILVIILLSFIPFISINAENSHSSQYTLKTSFQRDLSL